MGPNKQHIDEVIKAKLEGLEAGYDPGSWDLLAHRMDFDAQQTVDGFFKSRLENIGTVIPPNDWDAFEKVLEAKETAETTGPENQFDQVAYEKLDNLQAPYKDHHWNLMTKRLEEEFSIRHQLYRYKVAEIALMALLLLTIFRFLPLLEQWQENAASADLQPNPEQSKSDLSDKSTLPYLPNFQTSDTKASTIQNPIANAGYQRLSSNSKTGHGLIPSVRSSYPLQSLNDSSSATDENSPVTISKWTGRPINILPTKEIKSQSGATESKTRIEEITAKKHRQEQLLAQRKQSNTNTLATSSIRPFNPSFDWELPTVRTIPAKKENELRFSIFTTTDINYVTTPPDQISVFGEPVQTGFNETLASGYGGGINISLKRGRWEYQTGGIYSFKRYIPNTPIFIFETLNFYIKEDFNGIQLDIFQVPLNALYHFKNAGRWHLYVSAGMSANFVTSTIYEFDVKKESLNPPAESNNFGRGSSPDDTKSIKQQKDFPDGLLDGGQLQDNFYMSANLGIGAEYYLSPKWTIFFQPNYQHFMMSGGIGTNNDKIYTTSIYLGTKFNLK